MSIVNIAETIALLPTAILLFIVISQYAILLRGKKTIFAEYSPTLSIIIPAHNEEKYIGSCIQSILSAEYQNKKEIIVINDGSKDGTGMIASSFSGVKVLTTNHLGKSKAMNEAIKCAKNEVIVVVDGDTEIEKDALMHLVHPLKDPAVGAVGGVVKVRNKKKIFTWFQNIEYLYSSFFNSLCDKINANIFTPGPISAFRKNLIDELGGFNTSVFLEDVDMALRLVKKGYKIRIAEKAAVRTNVPNSISSWSLQRRRWMKGGIEMVKNHKDMLFNKKYGASGFYPLPILSYWYFHSIIMGIVLLFQIVGGYYQYFLAYGEMFSINVFLYFFYWFSFFGIINLLHLIVSGAIPLTPLSLIAILVTIFSYPLYLYPFYKFKEKMRIQDIIALLFLFPYWLLVLIIQFKSNLSWLLGTERKNWWTK